MSEKRIDFYDDEGNLLPLESVQQMVEQSYNEVMEIIDTQEALCSPQSVLAELINPEVQVKGEEAMNTLSFLDRTLYLSDVITPEIGMAFRDAINFWNRVDNIDKIPEEERKPIKIYIDSPGGDLVATFSIIDCISMSKTPVWTITTGKGYSGGFFIGIAGHKRFGYPHSTYLFHEGSKEDGGDAHKFLQAARFYEKMLKKLKGITIKYTDIDDSIYEKHKKDDLWLFADEAKELGIIDEITEELI